ncbi:FUSC family protein [Crenobacter sp. SG2303]|uniref:FUSC family protein n=1 Tax=Crenobacter oryzisoli TaxID=3056844 RepID=A0ABT7XV67_9NEIS|nr:MULTISPECIES: FUSC family protein [unclassified Crenobacter]MDN0077668.1 FUSC family protein [Crenobacter sp. SG2303]MDN0085629.1 FUSC family protein [Crenobacter sp. SG2305]
MTFPQFEPSQQSLLYAGKVLIGCMIVWFGLSALGVEDPIWAAITVVIVSEPDFVRAREQVKARVINTLTGCAVSLAGILLLGSSLTSMLISVVVAVLLVTSLKRYPASWKLAPVTVLILMHAAPGTNPAQDLQLALLRAGEIMAGCVIVLGLAALITEIRRRLPQPFEVTAWRSARHRHETEAP